MKESESEIKWRQLLPASVRLSVRDSSLLEDEGEGKIKERGDVRLGSPVVERLPSWVFFLGGWIFWIGIHKWPAHSVRFSRRLERMEEWKKERGGREREEREGEQRREEAGQNGRPATDQ